MIFRGFHTTHENGLCGASSAVHCMVRRELRYGQHTVHFLTIQSSRRSIVGEDSGRGGLAWAKRFCEGVTAKWGVHARFGVAIPNFL